MPNSARNPSGPRRLVSPWYLAYLVLGLINSGMLPFLLPLAVARAGYGLGGIAYVIGAYNFGLMPAPLLGVLAERQRLFRPVFFYGFIALAVPLAVLPELSGLLSWVGIAMLVGCGSGAVATVAPLFVVDFAPKEEWESRIGWLQSFNGAGQLIGLLLAGAVAEGNLAHGFWIAAACAAAAIIVGQFGLPVEERRRTDRPPRLAWRDLMETFHPAPAVGGLLQQSHHLQDAAWRRLPDAFGGAFGRFVLAWAMFNLSVAPFFAYYPLLMKETYAVAPTTTALLYALAACIGIGVFPLAGWLARGYGPRFVFRLGLGLRLIGFAALAMLVVLPGAPRGLPFAALGFVVIMLAWPVLSVSGTDLAARLTPIGEGAAMGLLAASTAAATVIGTFLGGPLVAAFGYNVVLPIALVGLISAEALAASSHRG
ncbi:MAG TPA: MFS transporter [Stellaceae bacterium]|nr:MFS transporter [Stellaceae bacterium]